MRDLTQMAAKRSEEAEYLTLVQRVLSAAKTCVYAGFSKANQLTLTKQIEHLATFEHDHKLED